MAEMAGVMGPLSHHHHRTVQSPPSPSVPIKGTPTAPHLAAPYTALLSTSLMPELAPTARFHHHCFATITRSLHRRSVFSEGTPDIATSPSPSSAPRGDYRRAVAPTRHAPVGAPPCSWLHHRGPRWTKPPAWSTGHVPSLPIIQYKNNSVYSKEKPSLQGGPCFCLKSSSSPIKFQTTPLEFKSISRYNPSHFPKSQIGH
jgi:hypothetical protein